jgi:transposase-like protein
MLNCGMPWKASSVMDERMRFVVEVEQGEYSVTELCQIYGVSRETGYVWLRRYGAGGVERCATWDVRHCAILTRRRRALSSRYWSCGGPTCVGDRAS